jgi:hypothetical protein
MTATKECTSDPFLFLIYSVIFIFEFQIYSIYIPSIYVASIFLTFFYYYLLHFQSEIAAHESEKKDMSFNSISFSLMNLEDLLSLCNFLFLFLRWISWFFNYGFGSLHHFAATFVVFCFSFIHQLQIPCQSLLFWVSLLAFTSFILIFLFFW